MHKKKNFIYTDPREMQKFNYCISENIFWVILNKSYMNQQNLYHNKLSLLCNVSLHRFVMTRNMICEDS